MSLSDSPGTDRLNELLADYELISELGRGGTSVVYLARERELDRDVAIKVVRSNQLDDAEAVARLAREAKLVALLRHPNIVPLLSTRHLSDGSLALIMQHVPGHTLKSAIREAGPLPIAVVEHVLREIGAALDYAHRRHGIIHRDIKPENIYLDEECGRALLSDFGIARPGEADSNLTLAGTALGTPAYMSPEQIDGVGLDGRSDLYSLGLVAYEMLTGQQPWAGSNLYTIIYKQKHEDLPPLSTFRSDVPKQLERTIAGLLHKDREVRWNDAAQFLAQLPTASANVLDLAVPRREVAAEASVSDDMPTLRYRRDEVEIEPVADEAPAVPPMAASASTPEPEQPLPVEVPSGRRPAPGRSYAMPESAPIFAEVAEPAPVPMPLPKAAVAHVRKAGISARAFTFAHLSKPRSRLVAATTAVLVLGVTATVVATMSRGRKPEVNDTRAGLASPAAPGMMAAGAAVPSDTLKPKPEQQTATSSDPQRTAEKASEPRSEPRADAASTAETKKENTEETVRQEPAPEPAPKVTTQTPPAALPTVENATASSVVRDQIARDFRLPTNDTGSSSERTEVDANPVFTPYTVKPELRNRQDVQRALSRHYPRRLRESGVGGVVMVWALIDEDGKVSRTQLKTRSGVEALDQAAISVAQIMRFSPALNRDQKVRVWIELPLVFKPE